MSTFLPSTVDSWDERAFYFIRAEARSLNMFTTTLSGNETRTWQLYDDVDQGQGRPSPRAATSFATADISKGANYPLELSDRGETRFLGVQAS